ncbi:uncharacterized protein PGTG_20826 [Puccinia graminis f. sp. tritici CRL 75-36-700-3]|uniref:Uncharacterized protein n=1 Tax=Puccinia graminis f. sp. tritici (strain CRL 75-36-700-3 / race SCCL) TaxID=418459 RepID=H6QPM7_PUCGT|nr:uncharacterized protein PGTG_20826 [Puccinia graminis f. sp. tritici CRL 75-36-700-3]EHS64129.1 hypothetical protein PGTG_20826 [Puccinia graminis f. sp. tritici CRL 75-36-700-3]
MQVIGGRSSPVALGLTFHALSQIVTGSDRPKDSSPASPRSPRRVLRIALASRLLNDSAIDDPRQLSIPAVIDLLSTSSAASVADSFDV